MVLSITPMCAWLTRPASRIPSRCVARAPCPSPLPALPLAWLSLAHRPCQPCLLPARTHCPYPWLVPLRLSSAGLGTVLLTPTPSGGTTHLNATRALDTFAADLQNYPENAFSLRGTAMALKALGRVEAARGFDERASIAWQFADVPLRSPCPQLA